MIQLSRNITMFAVFLMPTRTKTNLLSRGTFLCPIGSIVSKDIRLSNPILQSPLTSLDCSCWRKMGGDSLPCIYTHSKFRSIMPTRNEFCNAGNNSICTATSAHDTRAVSLTGNPYQDLAAFGFDLHGCQITYRKSPNPNGHTVTGRFNISGYTETGAGNSYEELILYIVNRHNSHRQYISLCHKQKRDRNFASWLSRHPEYQTEINNQ